MHLILLHLWESKLLHSSSVDRKHIVIQICVKKTFCVHAEDLIHVHVLTKHFVLEYISNENVDLRLGVNILN